MNYYKKTKTYRSLVKDERVIKICNLTDIKPSYVRAVLEADAEVIKAYKSNRISYKWESPTPILLDIVQVVDVCGTLKQQYSIEQFDAEWEEICQ